MTRAAVGYAIIVTCPCHGFARHAADAIHDLGVHANVQPSDIGVDDHGGGIVIQRCIKPDISAEWQQPDPDIVTLHQRGHQIGGRRFQCRDFRRRAECIAHRPGDIRHDRQLDRRRSRTLGDRVEVDVKCVDPEQPAQRQHDVGIQRAGHAVVHRGGVDVLRNEFEACDETAVEPVVGREIIVCDGLHLVAVRRGAGRLGHGQGGGRRHGAVHRRLQMVLHIDDADHVDRGTGDHQQHAQRERHHDGNAAPFASPCWHRHDPNLHELPLK